MLGKAGILIVIFVLLLAFYFVISWGAGKRGKRKDVAEEQNSAPIMHDILKPITLEDLTNPDNKK